MENLIVEFKINSNRVGCTSEIDINVLILELIDKNLGIRYRDLLRQARLADWSLQYHLRILEMTNNPKGEDKTPK